MFDMSDADLSPLKMFSTSQSAYFDPQPTISLAEADLLSSATMESSHESSPSPDEVSADDKKPVKKRKSWGQELPVPKTNLPPRKRAKTDDEKEQRRIERVLRNRAAAQSSRERKRQEVEKLEGEKKSIEHENIVLRQRVLQIEQEKWKLQQQLSAVTARLGGSINIENITPPPVSPEMSAEMYQIKMEPIEQGHGLPSPGPSQVGPGSISEGHRSRSASLQSEMLPPQQHNQMMVHGQHHVPSPLDLTHRPAAMMLSHDLQFGSVKNDGMINEKKNHDAATPTTVGITINVNGETVEQIDEQNIVGIATEDLSSETEQEGAITAFDALINDMSPKPSSNTEFTPSPEAPSLSFFEESFTADTPSEELPSPDFGAFAGDLDFHLDFDSTGKNEAGFDESSLLFAPLDNEIVNFDSLSPTVEIAPVS